MRADANVIRLPGLTHRVRIAYPEAGVAAVVDVKVRPTDGFVADLQEVLERLYPLLVEQDAVLLQFGPVANLHAPGGPEVPAL